MNRALLVGINAYPGAPLQGCVNDVLDMAHFLTSACGFAPADIDMLTDRRATTSNIFDRLGKLVSGLQAGDRVLFHYSGHGAQMATRDVSHEVDGLDEVICPVDFDWSDRHVIRDKDFARIFGQVPGGVDFVWVSDSCHSGDLSRDIPFAPDPLQHRAKAHRAAGPRTMHPPVDLAWRLHVARAKGLKRPGLHHAAAAARVALVSGCRSDETSADAYFERANGALTYFLLQQLRGDRARPLPAIVEAVGKVLGEEGFTQHPQCEGSAAIMERGFLC